MYQYNQCLYCINKTDRHDVNEKLANLVVSRSKVPTIVIQNRRVFKIITKPKFTTNWSNV